MRLVYATSCHRHNRDILHPSERGTEVILSMYIKKRSGPKTEPCGTPEITVVDSDPLTTTC